MKTTLKVLSIISLIFVGLALLGNFSYGDTDGFMATLIIGLVWVPQSILILMKISKE